MNLTPRRFADHINAPWETRYIIRVSTLTKSDTTHMSQKLDVSVVCYLIQAFVKPTTLLWLAKLLFVLLVWIYVLRSKKCPEQDTTIMIINIIIRMSPNQKDSYRHYSVLVQCTKQMGRKICLKLKYVKYL